jgi:hypothetical protein
METIMRKIIKLIRFNLIICVFLFTLVNITFSQVENGVKSDSLNDAKSLFSMTLGSDAVSRYIWRGQVWENTFCIQPTLALNIGNFTIGVWGSYSMVKSQLDEQDLYLTYNLATNHGGFVFNLYDYYNTNLSDNYFNFKKDESGHVVEFSIGYNGTDNLPLAISASYNIFNDPDNSAYVEVGYNFNIQDIKLNLFCGGTKGSSDWYTVSDNKLAIINTGVSATKNIKLSSDFTLPVNITYILNPYIEKSFLVLKISI